jgi:hypothetical protein
MFVRPTEDVDLVEWEISAPPGKLLAYISSPVWEDLIWSRSDCWDGLVIDSTPTLGDKDIHALVLVPLPAGAVKCHGLLRPQYTREQARRAAELVRNPPPVELREAYDFDAS